MAYFGDHSLLFSEKCVSGICRFTTFRALVRGDGGENLSIEPTQNICSYR
jgi:hypothetical protein